MAVEQRDLSFVETVDAAKEKKRKEKTTARQDNFVPAL